MRGVGFLNTRIDGRDRGPHRQRGGRRAAGAGRAGAPRAGPGEDAAHRPGRVPRRRGTSSSGCGPSTVERARALPAAALHESVDGEWSFIETLRHLVVRDRVLAAAGDPRRPEALRRAVAALGRDAGHRRRAARPRRPGRRWTRPSRCGWTGRRRSAGTSTRSTTRPSPPTPSRSRGRAGRSRSASRSASACSRSSTRSGGTASSRYATSLCWSSGRGELGAEAEQPHRPVLGEQVEGGQRGPLDVGRGRAGRVDPGAVGAGQERCVPDLHHDAYGGSRVGRHVRGHPVREQHDLTAYLRRRR